MSALASRRASAWVIAFGFAVAALAPSTASAAAAVYQSERQGDEPFGLATIALPGSPLQAKWHLVELAIEQDLKTIASCRADRANCASPPALAFLKIIDAATAQTGLARAGEINRAFNLGIKAMSDQAQYGVEDLWISPLATLAAGAGDCEDYAIAKFVALREAGLPQTDLRLVVLRDVTNGEDHAVAAARIDGRWRMLDNRHLMMLEDSDVTKLQPIFVIDAEGAKRFVDPSVAIAALAPKNDVKNDTNNDPQPARVQADAVASSVVAANEWSDFEKYMVMMAM